MGTEVDLSLVKCKDMVSFRCGGQAVVRWVQRSSLKEDYRMIYFDGYSHPSLYSLSGEFSHSAGSFYSSQRHLFDIVNVI